MKKIVLTNLFFVFLMFVFNGVQAQAQQPKLDQLKLIQQFIGTWKTDISNDSSMIVEMELCGKSIIETDYLVVKGKKEIDSKWTYGYSPETNQFKFFAVYPNGNYQTWLGSFTSEKKWEQQLVQDFNPDKVLMKSELNFITPDTFSAFQMKPDGQKIGKEFKATRVKNP
jgi:hypothetical protein